MLTRLLTHLLTLLISFQLTFAPAQAGFQGLIGDQTVGENGWAEGSFQHVASHMALGCAMAELQGADCAAGAAASGAQALYAGYLDGTGPVSDKDQQRNAQIMGALAGYFLSGSKGANVSTGSSLALSGIVNNRQLHEKESDWIRKNAQTYADAYGLSYDEALAELTAETLRGVSDDFAHVNKNDRARGFITANYQAGQIVDGQRMFDVLNRGSREYLNSTINMGHFKHSLAHYEAMKVHRLGGGSPYVATSDGVARDTNIYWDTVNKEELSGFVTAMSKVADRAIAAGDILEQQIMSGEADGNIGLLRDLSSTQRMEGEAIWGDLTEIVWEAKRQGIISPADYASPIGADGQPNILYYANQQAWSGWAEALALAGVGGTITPKPRVGTDANRGTISGRQSTTTSSDPEAIRGINRENEAAQGLADSGYDVVQNPGTNAAGKNPDLTLNGEIYDVYSPSSNSPRNLGSNIQSKVDSGQTQNVVVNLADSNVTPAQLTQQLNDYPIQGLNSVVIIDQSGTVLPPVNFN